MHNYANMNFAKSIILQPAQPGTFEKLGNLQSIAIENFLKQTYSKFSLLCSPCTQWFSVSNI